MPGPVVVILGGIRVYKGYKAYKKIRKAKQAADAARKAKQAADAAKKAKKSFSNNKKGCVQNCPKKLKAARQRAVRQAWKKERELVRRGKGTRNWTKAEKKELLETGKVKGYQGHHKKPVAQYPELAGDPKNIRILSYLEHLAAHGKSPRIPKK